MALAQAKVRVIRGNGPLPLITDDEVVRDVPDPRGVGIRGTPGVFPMAWPGPQSQAEAMNTNTVNPEARLYAGGAGIPLYLAGLLLIPEDGSNQSIASSPIESLRSRSR